MFVKGYAFEVAIQRDLIESQIAHVAHDLHGRQERLAGHDLEVIGFHGDVKTSTYFVLARRSEMLAHDFYITRMYHAAARRWHRIVWLKSAFWKLLDGEPTPTAYDAIWETLPRVAIITLRSREFIVVFYDEWKRRVIARQAPAWPFNRRDSVLRLTPSPGAACVMVSSKGSMVKSRVISPG